MLRKKRHSKRTTKRKQLAISATNTRAKRSAWKKNCSKRSCSSSKCSMTEWSIIQQFDRLNDKRESLKRNARITNEGSLIWKPLSNQCKNNIDKTFLRKTRRSKEQQLKIDKHTSKSLPWKMKSNVNISSSKLVECEILISCYLVLRMIFSQTINDHWNGKSSTTPRRSIECNDERNRKEIAEFNWNGCFIPSKDPRTRFRSNSLPYLLIKSTFSFLHL